MSYEENKDINIDNELISTDGPLLIVLDEDDYDDENFDLTKNSNNILLDHKEEKPIILDKISSKEKQSKIKVKNLTESNKSKLFHRSSNQLEKSNKYLRTIVIDRSFTRQTTHQQQRNKSISKRKNMSTINNHKNFSIDTVLSYISFDNVSNILTISRMGSIYYCLEDLYIKVFSSLCTLDDFTNLLIKPQIIILKQVTLSEKISIEQQSPKLKKFNPLRYRLISINSSEYLIKLKQLLLTNKNKKNIEKIIDEMRYYKRTSTPLLLDSSSSSKSEKRMLTNDDDDLKTYPNKQKLTNPTQFGIFIQCNGPVNCNIYSTNEKVSSKSSLIKNDKYQSQQNLNKNLTKSERNSSSLIENIIPVKQHIFNSYNINTNDLSTLSSTITNSLHRSKSLIYNKNQIKKISSRSLSLPSIKFDIKDNIMLQYQYPIRESIDLIDDKYSMPMIVNVEENVEVNNQKIQRPTESLSYSQQSSFNNMIPSVSTKSSTTSIPYPYVYRPSSFYLTPIRTPYNLYHQESYQKSKELSSNYHDSQSKLISSSHSSLDNNNSSPIDSNLSSSIIMSILQKPDYYHSVTSEQQTSCHLPCCSHQPTISKSLSINIPSNERMIYQQYTSPSSLNYDSSQTLENPKSSLPIHRKLRRIETNPYPPTKTYFAPLSMRYPHPQNPLTYGITRKTDVYRPIPPVIVQNSSTLISPPNTPNELRLPYISTRSIDLTQAIAEHNHCDMDKIPKLVVRHTKTYVNKTIDTMGQLYPTWFNEPDYRCIHCFNCDQVFTPQQFMTHVDDEKMMNEQLLNMTSIQLLPSEKMSEYKVGLWNQFCTNLTIYASKFAEAEKKNNNKNSSKRRSNHRILNKPKILKSSTPVIPITSILTVKEFM